jgi:hypothetical protein
MTPADREKARRDGDVMLPDGSTLYSAEFLERESTYTHEAFLERGHVADIVNKIQLKDPGYDFVQNSNESIFDAAERWEREKCVRRRQYSNAEERNAIELTHVSDSDLGILDARRQRLNPGRFLKIGR